MLTKMPFKVRQIKKSVCVFFFRQGVVVGFFFYPLSVFFRFSFSVQRKNGGPMGNSFNGTGIRFCFCTTTHILHTSLFPRYLILFPQQHHDGPCNAKRDDGDDQHGCGATNRCPYETTKSWWWRWTSNTSDKLFQHFSQLVRLFWQLVYFSQLVRHFSQLVWLFWQLVWHFSQLVWIFW